MVRARSQNEMLVRAYFCFRLRSEWNKADPLRCSDVLIDGEQLEMIRADRLDQNSSNGKLSTCAKYRSCRGGRSCQGIMSDSRDVGQGG